MLVSPFIDQINDEAYVKQDRSHRKNLNGYIRPQGVEPYVPVYKTGPQDRRGQGAKRLVLAYR